MDSHQIKQLLALDARTNTIAACPTAFVCNTHDGDQPGEHWVVLYIEDRHGEYFDSYGLPPLHTTFVQFLNDRCVEWTYNNTTQVLFLTCADNTASLSCYFAVAMYLWRLLRKCLVLIWSLTIVECLTGLKAWERAKCTYCPDSISLWRWLHIALLRIVISLGRVSGAVLTHP